jgi:hypothetical protein
LENVEAASLPLARGKDASSTLKSLPPAALAALPSNLLKTFQKL